MKYQINDEQTQQYAQRYRIQAIISITFGCIGMGVTFTGLIGSVIMHFIDNLMPSTQCITVIALGLCLFGLGKIIAPIKPMALAFQELIKDRHVLEVLCNPIEREDKMAVHVLVETASGACEKVPIGCAYTCVHTKYTEPILDMNQERIYLPYQPAKMTTK